MNKLFLIKNPDLFQGEKYLNTNKNYFEGWYFKNTNNKESISFIPGINIDGKDKRAFIQVITNDSSYFINYNIDDFKSNFYPFSIKIKDNFFSKKGIHIDIKDKSKELNIYGDINYSNSKNINTSFLNPNIMGPFSYVPFMECNHAIISMQNHIKGLIKINNSRIDFNDDKGYIEKDWGCSFPTSYIWIQGNSFQKENTSFMISIADIPFKLFSFKGIICVLMIDNQEFRFTTYNNTKLIKYDINNELINITLKKGRYYLNIKSTYKVGLKLSAPVKGKMSKDIFESITSSITVTLKKDNDVIFSDTSTNCGVEIVQK
ncbi:MAG: tocopherol cyclase family protein [Anaeroplasma sp.]